MKRLLLALLFGASFAGHDLAHAQVAAPQHEACAIAGAVAQAPEAAPAAIRLPLPSLTLSAAVERPASVPVAPWAPARAPPR